MRRRMFKSKIHRATVTDADLHYVGSISLDPELMDLADILDGEQVHVLDIDNGNRFETYAITGQPGQVCLNGAAARLAHQGLDELVVVTAADGADRTRKALAAAEIAELGGAGRDGVFEVVDEVGGGWGVSGHASIVRKRAP